MRTSIVVLLAALALGGGPARANQWSPSPAKRVSRFDHIAEQGSAAGCHGCTLKQPKSQVETPERLGGTIKTWTETEKRVDVTPPPRDPWAGRFTGITSGDSVKLEIQDRSAPLDLERISGKHLPMSLRAELRKALRFRTVRKFDGVTREEPKFDSFGQTEKRPPLELGGHDVIPVHAPVRVTAQSPYEPGKSFVTNAEGRRQTVSETHIEVVNGRQIQVSIAKSGLTQEHYAAWATNLYVTPVFEAEGKGSARILGLAALPIGAKVTVTNVDMEKRKMPGATVALRPSKRTGSVLSNIPAPEAGAQYRLDVEFEGGYAAADTIHLSHAFSLPDPRSEAVKHHGVAFYPLELGEGKAERKAGQSGRYGHDFWYGSK
jgi:hypothetical protein